MRIYRPFEEDPTELAAQGEEVWALLPRPWHNVAVSNLGRVVATSTPWRAAGPCQTWINKKTGFVSVYLRRLGKVYVHRLVLEAFLGPAAGRRARRRNEVKTDNGLCNLYWQSR